jgi:hypothetical protein
VSYGYEKRRHTDKVTVLEVEAIQLVAGLLRIHHVFIDYESGALRIIRDALADLAAKRVSKAILGWLSEIKKHTE